MNRQMLTFAPGTSDSIDKFMGKPTEITVIISDKNSDRFELTIKTPFGWDTESMITLMMRAIISQLKIIPVSIHFKKMELIVTYLN